jgi:hypothetical protein
VDLIRGEQKSDGQTRSVLNLYAGSSRPVLFSDSELRAVLSLLLGGPKQWEEFRKSAGESKDEFGEVDS